MSNITKFYSGITIVDINEFTNDSDGFRGNKKPFGYRNFFN